MGFTFYEHAADYDWYRCDDCGALSIGRPRECPVCGGRGRVNPPEVDSSGFDAAHRRFKELLDKLDAELAGGNNEK